MENGMGTVLKILSPCWVRVKGQALSGAEGFVLSKLKDSPDRGLTERDCTIIMPVTTCIEPVEMPVVSLSNQDPLVGRFISPDTVVLFQLCKCSLQ
jgi:hypothetical protein